MSYEEKTMIIAEWLWNSKKEKYSNMDGSSNTDSFSRVGIQTVFLLSWPYLWTAHNEQQNGKTLYFSSIVVINWA